MTQQSTLSRTLQLTLCAVAFGAAGMASAQQPNKLQESSSAQTPAQASPSQARNPDGVRDHTPQTTAPSKSSMEARQPSQASPTIARSTDGRKDAPASHSTNHGPSQSQMEAMKPSQASPSTAGSPTGR